MKAVRPAGGAAGRSSHQLTDGMTPTAMAGQRPQGAPRRGVERRRQREEQRPVATEGRPHDGIEGVEGPAQQFDTGHPTGAARRRVGQCPQPGRRGLGRDDGRRRIAEVDHLAPTRRDRQRE